MICDFRLTRAALAIALCVLGMSPANATDAPLADAAEKEDWARVRTLLKNRADANPAQADGMTALHWAAYHDKSDVAKLLLVAGVKANVDSRDWR